MGSVHTYSMYNDSGERVWVKFHFRTQQGIENLTDEEAAEIIATDRDSSQRDLFEAIEKVIIKMDNVYSSND